MFSCDSDNCTYTHTIRCSQPDSKDSDGPELKMQISAREYEVTYWAAEQVPKRAAVDLGVRQLSFSKVNF